MSDFEDTNREKAEQWLFHNLIEVRADDELTEMLIHMLDMYTEYPCDFCSYWDKECNECSKLSDIFKTDDDKCFEGVKRWISEE